MPSSKKKGSTSTKGDPNATYKHGELVIADVSGYPKWPGCVTDKEHVPDHVLSQQPKGKPFIIRYLPEADYSFATAREVAPLSQSQVDAFLADPSKSKKKTGKNNLFQAYEMAKDHESWMAEQDQIVKDAKAAQEEEDQLEDEEDEVTDKSSKKKSSKKDSKAGDGKKRKRDDGAGGQIRESAAKKAEKKAKEGGSNAKKQKTDKAPTSSSKAAVGDDDDDESLDPESAKVKGWRHKLQRAFLGKEGTLKAEDAEANDQVFKTVEAYTEMTVEQLRASKIGKVMKRIVSLPGVIPRDDEFKFRERANALVNKWANVLSNGEGEKGDTSESKPSNGNAQEEPSQDKNVPSPKAATEASSDPVKTDAPATNGESSDPAPAASTTAPAAAEPKQDE